MEDVWLLQEESNSRNREKKVIVKSQLVKSKIFRAVAYPPNESFEHNARECRHSSHYI